VFDGDCGRRERTLVFVVEVRVCTRNKKNRTKQTEAPRPRASQKKAQPFVNFGSFLSSGIEIIFSEANGSSLA
jgi:hypothetical protein